MSSGKVQETSWQPDALPTLGSELAPAVGQYREFDLALAQGFVGRRLGTAGGVFGERATGTGVATMLACACPVAAAC